MDVYEQMIYVSEHLRDVPEKFKQSTEDMKKWIMRKGAGGKRPEVFVGMSNRTGGKTYFISYLLLKMHQMYGVKITIITRNGTSLGKIARGILNSAIEEFPTWEIKEKIVVDNVYSEIWLTYSAESAIADLDSKESTKTETESELLGYCVTLRNSRKLKDYTSELDNTDICLFDEFQTDTYIPDEVNKFVDLHISLARGRGKASRYLPVFMLSNSISIVNPYFKVWKLASKIQKDTKFYRETGLSLIRFVNEEVKKEQEESAFNILFKDCEVLNSSIDNDWMIDNKACVCKSEKSWGNCYYIATFIKNNDKYGLRLYDNGFFYVSRSIDETSTQIFTLSDNPEENIEIGKHSTALQALNSAFLKGKARFSDLQCKYDILEWI